jgi:hypothetical protein
MSPRVITELSTGYRKVIISGLRTRYDISAAVARKIIPVAVEQWGKLRRLEGGDIMHAHALVPDRQKRRDASYVHVREILRDGLTDN